MWVRVRSMEGGDLVRIDGLSKLTKIQDLRKKLVKAFNVPSDKQRLFYRGKQMEDGHTLFDYNVNVNDIIQILVRQSLPPATEVSKLPTNGHASENDAGGSSGDESSTSSNKENAPQQKQSSQNNPSSREGVQVQSSKYFKVGDYVDALDEENGAWFEVKITGIKKLCPTTNGKISNGIQDSTNNQNIKSEQESEKDNKDDDQTEGEQEKKSTRKHSIESDKSNKLDIESVYPIQIPTEDEEYEYIAAYQEFPEDEPLTVPLKYIRPRSRHKILFDEIEVGQFVMVNYNLEEKSEKGFFYDAVITDKVEAVHCRKLYATLFVGKERIALKDCLLRFVDDIFKVENFTEVEKRSLETNFSMQISPPEKRISRLECNKCKDNPHVNCKFCSCNVCGQKDEPSKQVMCDECDNAFHLWCHDPPLETVPDEESWFCNGCKLDENEVVRAGEKLKSSKKKSKMASSTSTSTRDWGRGMACVGRMKECTIVPSNHYGPIPGVEVGSMWKYRVQVSETGIHRPHVAGIHGRENDGAYSIVLAGGYEDDIDNGDNFTYTGSGGRDLSGNKRTAEQSSDQTLTRMNKALASNCNAPINAVKGAESKNWEEGKPVRVVRSSKGKKNSDYAPEEGIRYDGIYKVVKYWPEKGKSGFLVWRYLLRRDDESPAPWTKEGQKKIKQLGLTMQYPEGYLADDGSREKSPVQSESKKTSRKRKLKDRNNKNSDSSVDEEEEEEEPVIKITKVEEPHLPSNIKSIISNDEKNRRLWDECIEVISEGRQEFLNKIEELFRCICCQELVAKPVTTDCSHNLCKGCLTRAIRARVNFCPVCRSDFGKKPNLDVNQELDKILRSLFPGYTNGR